jgi:hypothetical protein
MAQDLPPFDGLCNFMFLPGNVQEELDTVLTVLRELGKRVSSPVVKACLDEARADIAFLATCEDIPEEVEDGERDDCDTSTAPRALRDTGDSLAA